MPVDRSELRHLHAEHAPVTEHAFLTEAEIKRLSPDELDKAIAEHVAAVRKAQREAASAQRVLVKLRGEMARRKKQR